MNDEQASSGHCLFFVSKLSLFDQTYRRKLHSGLNYKAPFQQDKHERAKDNDLPQKCVKTC